MYLKNLQNNITTLIHSQSYLYEPQIIKIQNAFVMYSPLNHWASIFEIREQHNSHELIQTGNSYQGIVKFDENDKIIMVYDTVNVGFVGLNEKSIQMGNQQGKLQIQPIILDLDEELVSRPKVITQHHHTKKLIYLSQSSQQLSSQISLSIHNILSPQSQNYNDYQVNPQQDYSTTNNKKNKLNTKISSQRSSYHISSFHSIDHRHQYNQIQHSKNYPDDIMFILPTSPQNHKYHYTQKIITVSSNNTKILQLDNQNHHNLLLTYGENSVYSLIDQRLNKIVLMNTLGLQDNLKTYQHNKIIIPQNKPYNFLINHLNSIRQVDLRNPNGRISYFQMGDDKKVNDFEVIVDGGRNREYLGVVGDDNRAYIMERKF